MSDIYMEVPDIINIDIKECIIMVGLPGRGKSFISYRINRYLNWIGVKSTIFNLGTYRRSQIESEKYKHEFFDFSNPKNVEIRDKLADEALADAIDWYNKGGRASIFDATNVTIERRKIIYNKMLENSIRPVFVESICDDQEIINKTLRNIKVFSPDYKGKMLPEEALEDFKKRIEHYKSVYVPINSENNESHYSYIKIYNAGRRYEMNLVFDYIQLKIVIFLMNQNISPKSIYLTRHGESKFNQIKKLGGDSELSEDGLKYAKKLATFINQENLNGIKVFTSTLKRTIETSKYLDKFISSMQELNEVNAGACDSMTYEEIEKECPEVFAHRKDDKLNFRYPQGESYKDVFTRIEPVLLEIERLKNVLVISHYAVIRCILSYFMNIPAEQTPYIDVPLNCIYKLTPEFCGCNVEIYLLDINSEETSGQIIARELSYISK